MNIIKELPKPQRELPFPLMKALENRRTRRKWQSTPVTDQKLSNLLWAACGINSIQTKTSKQKRTAPSATNCQEIKLYVALENGLFLYNETKHVLELILEKDVRNKIGSQKMMKSAPVGIIYVSDYSKMKIYLKKDENIKWFVSGTDTGFISQNIYLYCASANLNTAIIGLVNRKELEDIMNLKDYEKVVYTQVVGNSI